MAESFRRGCFELPRYGNINVHASLLPKYRGAAPVQWAIAQGETVRRNGHMLLNEGLDTGDILLQKEMAIRPEDTALTYAPRVLAEIGGDMIVENMRGLEDKSVTPSRRTTPKQRCSDPEARRWARGFLPRRNWRFIIACAAFGPWPGAYTQFRGKSQSDRAMPEDAP